MTLTNVAGATTSCLMSTLQEIEILNINVGRGNFSIIIVDAGIFWICMQIRVT